MKEEMGMIGSTFELQFNENALTEQDLLFALADRIGEMLQFESDILFSTLYRLDVSEKKINEALHAGDTNIQLKLAKLVLDRQKKRVETKKKYGFQEINDPELSL